MRIAAACVFAGVAIGAAAPAVAEEDAAKLAEQARAYATQIMQQMRGELTREMEMNGPLRSIVVCKYSSPEVTSGISRRVGARVTRVSLRPRNPALGSADVWEQRVLLEFERRVGKGERAEAMEFGEIVAEPQGRFFRYLKAIPMAQPCLVCHGPVDSISPAVKSMIAQDYPRDPATGYSIGQVRGGVTVKLPLHP